MIAQLAYLLDLVYFFTLLLSVVVVQEIRNNFDQQKVEIKGPMSTIINYALSFFCKNIRKWFKHSKQNDTNAIKVNKKNSYREILLNHCGARHGEQMKFGF